MSRFLITLGVALIALGILWPWLAKLGLGRLPGDFVVERENFRLYFPVTSSILISLALALLIWLLRK